MALIHPEIGRRTANAPQPFSSRRQVARFWHFPPKTLHILSNAESDLETKYDKDWVSGQAGATSFSPVWLKYAADCTQLKALKLHVRRPLSRGLSIVIVQQSAQALSAIDWPDFLAHFQLRGDHLIVERLVIQDFIGTAPWDHRPLIQVLVGQVVDELRRDIQ